MVIRCFRDDLADFVHDDFHGPPPIQRAGLVDAPIDRALVQAMCLNNGTLGVRIKVYVEMNSSQLKPSTASVILCATWSMVMQCIPTSAPPVLKNSLRRCFSSASRRSSPLMCVPSRLVWPTALPATSRSSHISSVSAAAMVRNLSNPVPGPGVPTHPLLHPKPRPVTRAPEGLNQPRLFRPA